MLLVGRHQAKEIAGLCVVIIAVAMVVALGVTGNPERRFGKALVLYRASEGVGFIVRVRALGRIEPHWTVRMIGAHGRFRAVDRQHFVVRAYSVAVRVG